MFAASLVETIPELLLLLFALTSKACETYNYKLHLKPRLLICIFDFWWIVLWRQKYIYIWNLMEKGHFCTVSRKKKQRFWRTSGGQEHNFKKYLCQKLMINVHYFTKCHLKNYLCTDFVENKKNILAQNFTKHCFIYI